MESRLNDLRIFGLPVQFVVVVALSLALTIYFGAYAADARINERAAQNAAQSGQQFDFSAPASNAVSVRLSGGIGQRAPGVGIAGGAIAGADAAQPAERQAWEYLFLIACPLH